jgi:hypothetical protein
LIEQLLAVLSMQTAGRKRGVAKGRERVEALACVNRTGRQMEYGWLGDAISHGRQQTMKGLSPSSWRAHFR